MSYKAYLVPNPFGSLFFAKATDRRLSKILITDMKEAKKYTHPIDPESVFPALIASPGSFEEQIFPAAFGKNGNVYLQFKNTNSSDVEMAKREVRSIRVSEGLGEKDIVLGVLVSITHERKPQIIYEETGIGVWARLDRHAYILPLDQSRRSAKR